MKNREEADNERTILRIASCFSGEGGDYPRKDSLGYMYPRRDKNQRPFKTRDNVRRTTLLFEGASLDRSYLRIVLDIH